MAGIQSTQQGHCPPVVGPWQPPAAGLSQLDTRIPPAVATFSG